MTHAPRREGFVLVSVLALLAVVGSVALLAARDARRAVSMIAHRTTETELRWLARGCLARARAAIDDAMSTAAEGLARDKVWRELPTLLAAHAYSGVDDCALNAEALGARADVNALDSTALAHLFEQAGAGEIATGLAASLLDWRDADDEQREGGAERAWYEAARRFGPANAPLASDGEIALVRGLEARPDLAALLTTRRGHPRLRDEAGPDAWIVGATARDAAVGHEVRVEQRLMRSQRRAHVVAEQSW